MRRIALPFFALLLSAACSEFATPAELSRSQILGLRVEPATLAPGQRGALEVLVAGPDGVIEIDPRWSVRSGSASIEIDADGAWLRVADGAALEPIELDVTIHVAGGGESALVASRTVSVAAQSRDNPVIEAIWARGSAADAIELREGETIDLELDALIDAEMGQVAWYSTLGEIELYRRPTTELEATEAGAGWLVAVCRDGQGGIDWRVVPLIIEPQP